MATPFSRTMRSLQADNFRPSLIFLAMAILLVIAWLGWFMLSEISIYESSESVYAVRGGNLAATFQRESLQKIKPGQTAQFELKSGETEDIQNIEATVFEVNQDNNEVVFFPYTALDYLYRNPQNITGTVKIAVQTISPASLLLQSSSQAASP